MFKMKKKKSLREERIEKMEKQREKEIRALLHGQYIIDEKGLIVPLEGGIKGLKSWRSNMERAWKDRDIQGITDKIDGNSLFGMYSVSKKWRIPDLSMEEEDKILLWFKQNGRYAETKQIKENICLLTYRMGNPYVLIAQYANQVLSTEIHTDRRLTSKLHCDSLLAHMEKTLPERAAEIVPEQPEK